MCALVGGYEPTDCRVPIAGPSDPTVEKTPAAAAALGSGNYGTT